MYSLDVIYITHYIPLTKLYESRVLLNSAGTLLVLLTHASIRVVYCHYMLTPFVECLIC